MPGKPRALLALPLLTLAAACQNQGDDFSGTPVLEDRVASIIDPDTNKVREEHLPRDISLAAVMEQELGFSLDPNDRRRIDLAFDEAMASAPEDEPTKWRNPANGHAGQVDLLEWLPDTRRGETCGQFEHVSRLGLDRDPVTGDVTVCKRDLETAWVVDSSNVSLAAVRPPVRPTPTPGAVEPEVKPQVPPVVVVTPTRPKQVQVPTPSNRPEEQSGQRVITRTSDDIVPEVEEGRQNIGDLLQDQAPHIEAD